MTNDTHNNPPNPVPTEVPTAAPNHHGHHGGFSGLRGLVAALSMTIGRGADAAAAADLARVDATDRVVDIGCGPGTAVRLAAQRGAHVTGVDPADVMLRVARLLSRGERSAYVQGTAEALPLPDGSVTVAWSLSAVHHWPELDAGIADVWRVLEPGGRFVVIEHRALPDATGRASHGWTDEQAEAFAASLRSAGFTDVRVVHPDAGRRPPVAVVAVRP